MKVLIVAKTRHGAAACINGIAADGRSIRMVGDGADELLPFRGEVGEVWEIEEGERPHVDPPHVEDVSVYAAQRLRKAADPEKHIERFMPALTGGPETLFEGLAAETELRDLYIARSGGIPSCSTLFWRPDQPLYWDEDHYRYEDPSEGPSFAFAGFQQPLEEIPAGSLVCVSLALWRIPDDEPDAEERCALQISGWFPVAAAVREEAPPVRAATESAGFEEALPTLERVFGYREFRAVQEAAIRRVLAGQDTLAVMPTGGGKSLCYQLPALLFNGLTVVVSPLISLMRDQVDQLKPLGIPATFLNSSLSRGEWEEEAREVAEGRVRILYLAPETLARAETQALLDRAGVRCFAIDEAHCISQWGHDFRPVYRNLLAIRQRYRDAVCIALTATAAPRVRADIQQILSIPNEGVLVSGFDRPNLFLAAQRRGKDDQLLAFLRDHKDQPGIVYCPTQARTEELADMLTRAGITARPYHAGLDSATRDRHQREFNRDEIQVIVATVAFGMGINKPNIRFVAHYSLPESLEGYYQEIGRAGRDGLRADCLLLFSQADAQLIRRFIDRGAETERPGRQARLNAVMRFASSSNCRRASLLPYFGDPDVAENCGMCDNCTQPASVEDTVDVTAPAQLFMKCVQSTGQSFGIGHITDVLRGSKNKKVLDRGHHKLPVYNAGVQHSAAQWRGWIDVFLDQGLIEQDLEHGSLRLLEPGREVLRGERTVAAAASTAVRPSSSAQADAGEFDQGLFEELRGLRKRLADAQNVPPYVVFSDRTLVEMARVFPQSRDALVQVHGVGQRKLDSYGAPFLETIVRYCTEHGLEQQPLAAPPPPPPASTTLGKRASEVGSRFAAGATVQEIQDKFDVKRDAVIQNLADFVRAGNSVDAERVLAECRASESDREKALDAFQRLGTDRLRPIFDELRERVPYAELHLLRLYLHLRDGDPDS